MKPDGRGLTSSATTRSRSTRSAGRPYATSSISRASSTPPARQLTLERNYRSSAAILAAANAAMALARERYTKNLWTERRSGGKPRIVSVRDDADQAGYVIERLLARRERGIKLRAQAVLFRACASQRTAGAGARAAQHSVRQVRRFEVPRSGPCEGCAGAAALARIRAIGYPGSVRFSLVAGIGPKTAARVLDHVMSAPPWLRAARRAACPARYRRLVA